MSDLLSIGSGSVQVYQRALGTTANNIANTATEGYSRQEAIVVDNVPRQVGPQWLGTGAVVESIGRNYDAFVEQSLRTSISDVETQGPLVNYIDRVVDIMGSQTTGLTGVLDSFFSAARNLSADAASPELRAAFLSQADGLAQRLRSLGGQLDVINVESTEAVGTQLDRINTLSKQIATVNAELNRRGLLTRQAPRLLDQRDSLLRELASVVKIRVKEAASGAVDVSIGTTDNRGKVVEGTRARQLDVEVDQQTLGVKLILDKRGSYEVVSGVSSGALGGLLSFRDQILAPSVSQLDFLAQTVASQFNSVHKLGMDMAGNLGGELFTIDPVFSLNAEASSADLAVRWEVTNASETRFHSIQLDFDPEAQRWTATDLENGKTVSGINDLSLNGMLIHIDGQSETAERITLEASNRPSIGIRRLIEDPRMVAAAAAFRVIENPLNPSGADATVQWQPDQSDLTPVPSLANLQQSSRWQTNTKLVDHSGARSLSVLGKISAGDTAVTLGMASEISGPMEIEVFTRDGRHIAGSILSVPEREAIVNTANGFVAGATYSGLYRNEHGADAYLDMSVLRGYRSKPVAVDVLDLNGLVSGTKVQRASITTERMPQQNVPADGTLIAASALGLNGYWLNAFVPSPQAVAAGIPATEVSAWMSGEVSRIGLADKIQVSAVNEIRAPIAGVRFDRPLTINGVQIVAEGSMPATREALITMINSNAAESRVSAYAGQQGEIILTNSEGNEGETITIGPENNWMSGESGNALGISSGVYAGRVQFSAKDDITDIRLEIGPAGDPSALSRIGLSTNIYIDGAVSEDLIVVAKGEYPGSFSVDYQSGEGRSLPRLRERQFEVTFVSDKRYQIRDVSTDTLVAERDYNALAGIHYQGLQLSLSRPPLKGDAFVIDGNQNGVGDNGNILRLAGLESSRDLVPGGMTIAESWHAQINEIGNLGNQARIAQEALEIVNQQAVEARDRISGVSLDEEAADLIRFQQAYQASARIIQTANQLFEAILQVR